MKKLIYRKINRDVVVFFLLLSFAFGIIVWTLQAVNYLDYVTQDGHGLSTYFMYTLHNLPKIIHRIIPFVYFISLFFILTNYELRNELVIFWSHGVKKLSFVNNLLYLSIILLVFQILMGSFFSPISQYKARTYLKNSDIDFFSSLIKEGKFINIVEGLTIFINSKNIDNSFSNIFIDDSSKNNTKMIYASRGEIIDRNNQKIFRLYNGEVINKEKLKINSFTFNQIDFGLSEFSTNTILVPKIQELPTKKIFYCFLNNYYKEINFLKKFSNDCDVKSEKAINQEIIKRIFKPFYIPLISIVCCFLIILPKSDLRYFRSRRMVFLSVFLVIVISETTLRYLSVSNNTLYLYLLFPIFCCFGSYLILKRKIQNV